MKKLKKAKQRQKLTPTIQVYLALGLFITTIIASSGSAMAGWEIVVFKWIYNLPNVLHPLFVFITQFGSIYVMALLLGVYLVKQHYRIVLRLLMVGTAAYLAAGVAKDLWGRTRPHDLLAEVVSRDFFVRGPGFPSGHVALAAALALTIARYLPKKYQWVAPVWIIGVGLSRIYLGVHAPLDIIGGFAIGWLCYALFRHVRLYDIHAARQVFRKPRRAAK